MMGEYVAFYGTLMSGLPPRAGAPDLRPHVIKAADCDLPGVLYDFGPYPALVGGEGRVSGELYRCISAEALSVMDAWEEYDAEHERDSLYLRRRVGLLAPAMDAWVYLWNGSLEGLPVIGSGDWRAHVRDRERAGA